MNEKSNYSVGTQCHLENQLCRTYHSYWPLFADKGTLQSALGVYKNPSTSRNVPISDITEGVDIIAFTHNHIDHYEPSVKQHLPKDIPFYTQPQDKAAILKDGFSNVETIEEA